MQLIIIIFKQLIEYQMGKKSEQSITRYSARIICQTIKYKINMQEMKTLKEKEKNTGYNKKMLCSLILVRIELIGLRTLISLDY